MANVLDLRRRIRSVQNTRQITKAMKMVAAARLRKAQERALAARPYAQMLISVLRSLVSRAEIYDPATGEPRNPLLLRRPERNTLLILISRDKCCTGAFNANRVQVAHEVIQLKAGKTIDIEVIGRKGRDAFRRQYPKATEAERQAAVEISGEHVGILGKVEFSQARDIAEYIVDRYTREEIDSVF